MNHILMSKIWENVKEYDSLAHLVTFWMSKKKLECPPVSCHYVGIFVCREINYFLKKDLYLKISVALKVLF